MREVVGDTATHAQLDLLADPPFRSVPHTHTMNPAAATRGLQLHWPSVAVTLAASAIASLSWKGFTRWWAGRNRAAARAKLDDTAAGASTVAAWSSASSAASSPAPSPSSLLDFLLIVGRCKVEKRTGWVNDEVPLPESVADHMYRMSVMAMCCANYLAINNEAAASSPAATADAFAQSISPERAMRMALVHDLAESLVGDITPTQFSGVSKADKSKAESEAMHTIASKLASAHGSASSSSSFTGIASEVLALWLEYESAATPTALYVKNLDKLEMYVQAFEYQQAAAATQAAAAQSGDAQAETAARLLHTRLQRFYQSMEETRLKAIAQDAATGSSAQSLIVGVIAELQRRIAAGAASAAPNDAAGAATASIEAAESSSSSMLDSTSVASSASTTDSFVFVPAEGLSMEEQRAMYYAQHK